MLELCFLMAHVNEYVHMDILSILNIYNNQYIYIIIYLITSITLI